MSEIFFARKSLASYESPIQQPPSCYESIYGLQLFECKPLRAKINTTACADNHRRGLNLSCLTCPAGRLHATMAPACPYPGAKQGDDVRSLRSSRSRTCIRCGERSVGRLMSESYCPACWNRSLEIARGTNSKGAWPRLAASKLRRVEAMITAAPAELAKFLSGKFSSTKVMQWEPISAGAALLIGIAASRQELESMLRRILPSAEIADFTEAVIEPRED